MNLFRILIVFVAVLAVGAVFSGAAQAADGAAVYADKCASCHGADAGGDTPVGKAMGVKSLLTSAWASEDAADKIAKAVREGVAPKMPALGSKLSDEEIDAVSKHVQGLAAAASK